MPLKLNIGLSKKIGQPDYGSLGASVHVELELDSGVIGEPDRLKQQIRHLFGLAKSSIDEELNGERQVSQNGHGPAANGNGGHGHASRHPANGRVATNSQVRAIRAITSRRGLDLEQLLGSRFRLQRPEDLSLADASALIDELKTQHPANGASR